jgi:erythronate-4-phosphate dehydrogenase
VNQYIASVLVTLKDMFGFSLKDRVLGVVGVGNVGTKVVMTADLMGMRVYLCDPPRARSEGPCGFITLEGILRECDIITFHVPLNRNGIDKTFYMIDDELLEKVNPGTVIINTSRGEVADTRALKNSLRKDKIGGLVLDVWENEPDVDHELLDLCNLATPHIAGYSADGKAMGTSVVVRELSRHFDLGIDGWETHEIPDPRDPDMAVDCKGLSDEEVISRIILHTYRVSEDDKRLRMDPSDFEKQRGDYPLRREFKAYSIRLENAAPDLKRTCRRMGFNIKE